MPTQTDASTRDTIETNSAGALTEAQRSHLRRVLRSTRRNAFGVVAILVIAVALMVSIIADTLGASASVWRALGMIYVMVMTLLIHRAPSRTNALTRDLTNGVVQSVEGPIGTRNDTSRSVRPLFGGYRGRHIDLGCEQFPVSQELYDAAPAAGVVRLYFVPLSRQVVNVELLAAPPSRAGPS